MHCSLIVACSQSGEVSKGHVICGMGPKPLHIGHPQCVGPDNSYPAACCCRVIDSPSAHRRSGRDHALSSSIKDLNSTGTADQLDTCKYRHTATVNNYKQRFRNMHLNTVSAACQIHDQAQWHDRTAAAAAAAVAGARWVMATEPCSASLLLCRAWRAWRWCRCV